MQSQPTVLVIAGCDSSGGAGVVRDIATLSDHGVAACCAITALTAQTDDRVVCIDLVAPAVVQHQIGTALQSRRVDAIKIGMLGSVATVAAVCEMLANVRAPIVLDPVLRSSSDAPLLDDAGIALLGERLLHATFVLTPNLPEAAALLGEAHASDETAMLRQARRLLERGPQAVLLKGGHARGAALDLLVTRNEVVRLFAERIAAEMRGTGCALSTSIAAALAQGTSLREACETAKGYVLAKLGESIS